MKSGPTAPSRFLYLWISALLVFAWTLYLAWTARTQAVEIGMVSGRLLAAILLGLITLCLTPVTIRRLRTWTCPAEARPFTRNAAYYRLVVLFKAGCFLVVISGGRRYGFERFSLYMLGALLLHRSALCFPARLQRVVHLWSTNRCLHILDLVLTNALVCLILSEVTIRTFMAAEGRIAWLTMKTDPLKNKLTGEFCGIPPNAEGYNDEEFSEERRPRTLRIAVVGDSFVVSYVPRPYGFVPRTEHFLREALGTNDEVELYNFGITASAPSEYVEILRRDALRFHPDVVLACFYVGNDVHHGYPRHTPLYKRWYAIYRFVEDYNRSRQEASAQRNGAFTNLAEITDTSREYWFTPGNVPPVFKRDKYLEVAAGHLDVCRRESDLKIEGRWAAALTALEEMKRICDENRLPLLLVISPEHAQVSEALFKEVADRFALDPADYDLGLPQGRLKAFCAEHRMECMDLTGAFLESRYDPDHLYLENDTHWSALGNEVAGRTLAKMLEEWLIRTKRWPP